jgi:hypothetical protein
MAMSRFFGIKPERGYYLREAGRPSMGKALFAEANAKAGQ